MERRNLVAKAVFWGFLGSLGLSLFYYLILLVATKDFSYPLTQFGANQPWMGFLVLGFGIQVGLYSIVRAKQAGAVTGVGAGVSGLSMVACCAHHLMELIPILGISGLAVFLGEYQKEFLILGVVTNMLGIGFMIWMLKDKVKLIK